MAKSSRKYQRTGQAETEAEEARFAAFIEATDEHERNWMAFLEFEQAIHSAVLCATLFNAYDNEPGVEREHAALTLALSQMLFQVLPRVDLGPLIADVEGIGSAIRYGIIAPRRDALDGVQDTAAYQALAQQGYAAERADLDRRVAELTTKSETPKKTKQ